MTARVLPALAVCAVPFVLNPAAVAAGFDCSKAATPIERMICADEELSALDELLTRFYAGARFHLGEGAGCLEMDQRSWLAQERASCRDEACLGAAYRARLAEWTALQPGMAVPNDIEFPSVAVLRWILPPSPDSEPLPRLDDEHARFEGILVAEEGGRVLEAKDGTLHIVIPDLHLSEADAIALDVLEDARTRVIVSGPHGVTAGGDPAFDNRACVFIHER